MVGASEVYSAMKYLYILKLLKTMKKLTLLLLLFCTCICLHAEDKENAVKTSSEADSLLNISGNLYRREYIELEKFFWNSSRREVLILENVFMGKKIPYFYISNERGWNYSMTVSEIDNYIKVCDYLIKNVISQQPKKNVSYSFVTDHHFSMELRRQNKKEWKFIIYLNNDYLDSSISNDGKDIVDFLELLKNARSVIKEKVGI